MKGKAPLSSKQAVVAVLTKAGGGPIKTSELIAAALKLATGLKGNAKQTLYSSIYSDAKRENGVLVKTAPGMIALRDGKPKAAPKAEGGGEMMPTYLVILDVIYHGSSYGTTRDEIEADTEEQAVEEAIRQWKKVRPDRTFNPLLSAPFEAIA